MLLVACSVMGCAFQLFSFTGQVMMTDLDFPSLCHLCWSAAAGGAEEEG